MEALRYLASPIRKDALQDGKMAFIFGPRQVGKTWLARQLLTSTHNYFNWDVTEFKMTGWSLEPESVSCQWKKLYPCFCNNDWKEAAQGRLFGCCPDSCVNIR